MSQANRVITEEEVNNALNLAEYVESALDAEDDYQRAILHNLAVLTKAVAGKEAGDFDDFLDITDVDKSSLPLDIAGLSLEDTTQGNTGKALFQIGGTPAILSYEANGPINDGEMIEIIGGGNVAAPTGDLLQNNIFGFGTGDKSVSPDGLNVHIPDSDTSVGPADGRTTVAEFQVDGTAYAVQVGANNIQDTSYQYTFDDEPLFTDEGGDDSPIGSPLGTVGTPYELPRAVKFENKAEVQVERTDPNAGAASFNGNITFIGG